MNLFFAYPVMLWGLAAGAIPLLIHLLRRRQASRQVLPTVRFLREVHRRQRVNLRLQDLLLLILRTLLILILVLALAGPKAVLTGVGRGWGGWLGQGKVQRVILLDNSRSMQYRDASGTRFERAVAGVQRLLDELPRATETLVLAFSDGSGEDERAAPASFSRDRSGEKSRLELLRPTERPSRIAWGLRRASELLSEAADGGVFVLTDLQRSGWADLLAETIRPGEFSLPVSVIDVSQSPSRNVWIQRVEAPSLPVGAGEYASIEVEVASAGFPGGTQLPYRLEMRRERSDEGEALLAEREFLLTGGKSMTLALPFQAGEGKALDAWLVLSAQDEKDALEEDNRVRVRLPLLERLKVLVFMESVPAESGDAERSKEESFLERCFRLGLETPGGDGTPAFIQTQFVDPARDASPSLDADSVVLLYGPPVLSSEWQSRLVRFVREGGGLLVFLDPGWPSDGLLEPSSNPGSGRGRAGRAAWLEPLGFSFETLPVLADGGSLQLRAKAHPAFQRLEIYGEQLFQSVQVWKPVRIDCSDGEVLAHLRVASGTSELLLAPILAERRLDSGRAVVCGIPLQRGGSNLGTSALWVPLIQRMVKHLSTSGEVRTREKTEPFYPAESDLTRLSAEDKSNLAGRLPIAFSPLDHLTDAIAEGQGSRDLTVLFLGIALGLGLIELFVSNRL